MAHESILAHLAPLLTNQIENVATDALAHLLNKYHFVPNAFREYISFAGIDLPDNLSFKTQARWQDSAIPDLVGHDEKGRELLIIESKFWASLTPNQPNTYIERLPSDKPSILLFIAPASRMPTLWKELLNRCNPSYEINQIKQETTIVQFCTLRLNSKHILALTSWESLLAVLFKRARQAKDKYATGNIWQLQSLIEKTNIEAFHPLAEEEILSPTKKRISQYRKLLDELVGNLIEKGVVSTEGYHATPGPDFYKRYMSIQGLPNSDWCLEYNNRFRKQYPSTNLWLTARETSQSTNLFINSVIINFHHGKQFIIPLGIPISVEREAVLNNLYSQVVEIVQQLINQ